MFLSFFFSSRRRHTRFDCDWSSDVCSSDLATADPVAVAVLESQARISGGTTPYQSGNTGSFGGALSAPNGSTRSEERRVGEEWRSRWAPDHLKKKKNDNRYHQ